MKHWRHLAFGLILLLVASVPSRANSLDCQTKILLNGMKLVYRVQPDSPTVTIRFIVPAGFLTEPKELRGISHLLEHLIYRGNANYSKEDFIDLTARQGGSYNGLTGLDCTQFFAVIPPDNYLKLIQLYLNIILHPGLSEKDVTLEKKIVTVEKSVTRLPGDIVQLYLSELTEQRFNWDVSSITRDQIERYHQQFYHTNLMTVIITGAFNPDDVVKILSGFKEDVKFKQPEKPQWVYNFSPSDITMEDYLQGEKYKLLYGFDLKQASGKELIVAKVLPYILSYENRNFDNITNRPLDYDIGLINFIDRFYLVFIYRDCQEEYTPQIGAWHQKNLDRYCRFLKTKKFDKFLERFTDYLSQYFESLDSDSLELNEYYFDMLFEPTAITDKDLSAIRNLSSGDFKSFVQKYLEGKPYQKIVITAKK